MKKTTWILGLLLSYALLSGCASQVHNTKSLKQQNHFAIVSVTGLTSGFGMSGKEETELATTMEKVVYKELKNTTHFKLAEPAKVLKSRSYAAIKAESTDGLMTPKAAKGYKKFELKNETAAIAKLEKELGLTGVIAVGATFVKKDSGFSISGILPVPVPVSAGTTHGEVMFHIVAYDKNHEVIWQDVIEAETKDSVGNVMGVANLSSLYPQLIDAVQQATQQALQNLDSKLM